MILCFELSMPNRASWNGKWSGEGRPYVKTHDFGRRKERTAHAQKLLEGKHFSYNFGDGWRASIEVTEVTRDQANVLKKKSAGFCGYDWMVDSLVLHGGIYSVLHPKPEPKAEPQPEECAGDKCRFGD